jgi:hypothetical protein
LDLLHAQVLDRATAAVEPSHQRHTIVGTNAARLTFRTKSPAPLRAGP